MKKSARTTAPVSQDQLPDESTRYVVAAYCSNCRCHFDITVDFSQSSSRQSPCRLSDPENPLHHLRLSESADAKEYEEARGGPNKYDKIIEAHRFECSGVHCPVVVDIKISPPRLGKEMLSLVLDAKRVFERGQKVIHEDPERFEKWIPLSNYQILANLRQYLYDARKAQASEPLKKIAKRNKKLLLGFSDECDSLFDYLDFKVVTEDGPEPDVVRFPLFHFKPIS
jgi:ubiquitin carboxyl-terminal hydrolase 25/28